MKISYKARPVPALVVLALLIACLSAAPALAAPIVTLFAGPVTGPAGGVWLPGPAGTPGHLWVSDAAVGLCRVDAGLLNHCRVAAKTTGSTSFAATTGNVI